MLIKIRKVFIMLQYWIILIVNYSLKDTESAIRIKLKDLVTELKGFEFVMPLVLEFKNMQSDGETKYRTFYVSSKAEILINESDVNDVFGSIYITIISNIQKSFGKGSGWIIDSVVDHTLIFQSTNS